jgi:hypothetical protein
MKSVILRNAWRLNIWRKSLIFVRHYVTAYLLPLVRKSHSTLRTALISCWARTLCVQWWKAASFRTCHFLTSWPCSQICQSPNQSGFNLISCNYMITLSTLTNIWISTIYSFSDAWSQKSKSRQVRALSARNIQNVILAAHSTLRSVVVITIPREVNCHELRCKYISLEFLRLPADWESELGFKLPGFQIIESRIFDCNHPVENNLSLSGSPFRTSLRAFGVLVKLPSF